MKRNYFFYHLFPKKLIFHLISLQKLFLTFYFFTLIDLLILLSDFSIQQKIYFFLIPFSLQILVLFHSTEFLICFVIDMSQEESLLNSIHMRWNFFLWEIDAMTMKCVGKFTTCVFASTENLVHSVLKVDLQLVGWKWVYVVFEVFSDFIPTPLENMLQTFQMFSMFLKFFSMRNIKIFNVFLIFQMFLWFCIVFLELWKIIEWNNGKFHKLLLLKT